MGYSPLPLPRQKKFPPPTGFTGSKNKEPNPMATEDEIATWVENNGRGNVALRLPPGVVGIDVDAHKGQAELDGWNILVDKLGPLPEAPWCSSRDDDVSGIRLFRVPDSRTSPKRRTWGSPVR